MKSKKALRVASFARIITAFLTVFYILFIIFLVSEGFFSDVDFAKIFEFVAVFFILFSSDAFLIIIGYKTKKRDANLPDILIVYDDGQLKFADGYTCSPADILKVEYRRAQSNSGYISATQSYGRLKVYTMNKTITYYHVEDVEDAHNRLIYYMKGSYQELDY